MAQGLAYQRGFYRFAGGVGGMADSAVAVAAEDLVEAGFGYY